VIHKDAPDHLGCDTEKMRPVAPANAVLVNEAEKGLMRERRALQSIRGTFAAEVRSCEPPQFPINEGHQFFKSAMVAFAPVDQQTCNIVARLGIAHPRLFVYYRSENLF
jgi:hypothetical protein